MVRFHTLLGFKVDPTAEIDSLHVGLARVPTMGFECTAIFAMHLENRIVDLAQGMAKRLP